MITRRQSLIMLGSFAATPLYGQNLRRDALPPWLHMTRIRGMAWQTRGASTLFFDQTTQRMTGAQWSPDSKDLLSLFFLEDPGNVEMEQLFRLYEVRRAGEFDRQPRFIEDMVYPSRTRLREFIWTQFYQTANENWSRLLDPEHPNRVNIGLPEFSPVLWVMPTNDEPAEDTQADLDLGENQDHILTPLIEGMLNANVPFASSSHTIGALRDGLDVKKTIWHAKLNRTSERSLYTHAYFRIFRSRMKP